MFSSSFSPPLLKPWKLKGAQQALLVEKLMDRIPIMERRVETK